MPAQPTAIGASPRVSNRERRATGLAPINRKRVLRILGQHGLTLERCTGWREGRLHDGKVAVMTSNLRWSLDGLGIVCWNREKVRIAFIIDAFDREIIAHVAVAGATSQVRMSAT